MSAPAIGLRPRVTPAAAATIDASHPLAARLVGLFTPASIPALTVNSGAQNQEVTSGPFGLASSRISATGGYQYLICPGAAVNTDQSMFCWFTTPSYPVSGFPTLMFCNTVALNLETFSSNAFGATKRGVVDVPTTTFSKPSAGSLTFAGLSFTTATNRFTLYLGSPGTALQSETPANASALSSGTTNNRLYIGSVESSQGMPTGTKFHIAGLYARALSANEMGALFADPFQMLRY